MRAPVDRTGDVGHERLQPRLIGAQRHLAQACLHPREQLGRLKRDGQEVDPRLERCHHLLHVGEASPDENEMRGRELRIVTGLAAQGEAVQAWHVPVGNHELHGPTSQGRKRPDAVGLADDPVGAAVQHGAGHSGTVT